MPAKILPADPIAAIEKLIEITTHLKIVLEEERRAISLKNENALRDAETVKERLLPQYQQAGLEFGQRLEEFRSVDKVLLDELQGLQDALGIVARENQFHLAS